MTSELANVLSGGDTTISSVVGLLPMALMGINIDDFLEGASAIDIKTRPPEVKNNAALLMALSWHHVGEGKGSKAMVILPYKDRLNLLSKYLQQLVMESLGKEFDRENNQVHQGITVYGNKGSTMIFDNFEDYINDIKNDDDRSTLYGINKNPSVKQLENLFQS